MTSDAVTPRGALLARAVVDAGPLFERFLAGFDEASRTHQAPGLPNHVAWTLGHLGLYLHRGAGRVSGSDETLELPRGDFVTEPGAEPGAGTGAGGAGRYETESVCFGSVPVDEPGRYPTLARGVEVFRGGLAHLESACGGARDEMLDRTIAWGAWSMTGEALAVRMVFHVGIHAGQVADLRRALGMGTIIG